MSTQLSRLEPVNLREIWSNEGSDFTPWLSQNENLSLLGNTIGLELEFEAQEKDVGPFRADVLCKDTATNNWVLIENQLERTDHSHLGQLLTYAAGLKAVTIVWIADRFTDEHRAALDWLNEITDDRFNFFGLEIEVWKIANSPAAPKFNVISQPNDWSRTVAKTASRVEEGTLSEGKQLQLAFWTGFRDYAREHAEHIKPTKPHPQPWMDIALGKTGVYLTAVASLYDSENQTYDSHEIRAEVSLSDKYAKAYFEQLERDRERIEEELEENLTWRNPENSRMCRLFVRESVGLHDQEQWGQYYRWLVSKLDAMHRVFSQRAKQLMAQEIPATDDKVEE